MWHAQTYCGSDILDTRALAHGQRCNYCGMAQDLVAVGRDPWSEQQYDKAVRLAVQLPLGGNLAKPAYLRL